MEGVGALGHVDDVLAMQNVVGDRSIHRFPHPQALSVVNKAGGGAALAHLLELAAVLPKVRLCSIESIRRLPMAS